MWGINFVRGDPKSNSFSSWAPVPIQFIAADLGFTGGLKWDEPPSKVKSNFSIIPYALGSFNRDFEEDGPRNLDFQAGLDAKAAISTSLNLDLTLNPDFSQVEVDEQVTNLTLFNVRFPERRLFFLENSDLFEDFGIPPMRPFFSRKIGLDENGNPIPMLFGTRLSGNITKDLRIGVMNMQTKKQDQFTAQNYTSLAMHQRVLKRSVVKGYFHNRQSIGDGKSPPGDFNRNGGVEFSFRTLDGRWQGISSLGMSASPDIKDDNYFYIFGGGYDGRKVSWYTNFAGVGNDYIADVGFIPLQNHYDAEADTVIRVGFNHWFGRFSYTLYPEMNPRIISHELEARNILDVQTDLEPISNRAELTYTLSFINTSVFDLKYSHHSVNLLFPFSFIEGDLLPVGEYDFDFAGFTYTSDKRKLFGITGGLEHGTFYNGTRTRLTMGLKYRIQPWGNFGIIFEQNNLKFPSPYQDEIFYLISPKIEINFSRSVFWTTFLQYNTQQDNYNINSRFQWRFQPMSDLFIVYTDNYAVEVWGPKNRALVIKLNYWLNL